MSSALYEVFNMIGKQFADVARAIVGEGVNPFHFWSAFFILFAIVYAIMDRIDLLSGKQGAKFVLSLIISFIGASSAFASAAIVSLFPPLAIIVGFVIALFIALALINPDLLKSNHLKSSWVLLIVFLVLLIGAWMSLRNELPNSIVSRVSSGISSDVIYSIVWIAVIIIILFILVGGTKGAKDIFG